MGQSMSGSRRYDLATGSTFGVVAMLIAVPSCEAKNFPARRAGKKISISYSHKQKL